MPNGNFLLVSYESLFSGILIILKRCNMNIFQVIYHYCNSLGRAFGLGALEGGIIYVSIFLYAYTVAFEKKGAK